MPSEGTAHAKPVVLVGKGITFDTGGYSLKSRDGMRGMKYDKSGAMAVIGAMHAVATVIRPSFPVVGLLCLAENAVSGEGFRPDDIITYRNGTTVEITNTDAEGRLVLADGLIWAAEKENPAVVLNIATLTGACVTALGNLYAGVWSRHRELVDELLAIGDQSGDALWPLPLHPVFREKMESEVADMVNSDLKAAGGSNKAAAFLADFVPESLPWAHIDMAGTSDTNGTTGLPDGPSGYGVRLFAEFIAGRMTR
jgi:leucyl aminopeptidase